jgi:hypothetical protein
VLFATLLVAFRLSPMNRTFPSTARSSTTRPFRVTNWMWTFTLVAPVTVVTARRVSLPGEYFSTMRQMDAMLADFINVANEISDEMGD